MRKFRIVVLMVYWTILATGIFMDLFTEGDFSSSYVPGIFILSYFWLKELNEHDSTT